MSLAEEIAAWDGKSADDISDIYLRYSKESTFVPCLLSMMKDASLQIGASWLLKRHCDDGAELTQGQVNAIYKLLPGFTHWETKLHILQSMSSMPVVKEKKQTVESFLRACMTDSNKFVRAWTYNGFYELARQYPEFQQEVKQFFEMAMRDEAASVKARIRNIVKKGF